MQIRRIRLTNYKRFTDLTITGLPETLRLVVLVGPNGTGKSSVFDSFLLKAKTAIANYSLTRDRNFEQYYEKVPQAQTTHEVAGRVQIEFHHTAAKTLNWKSIFQVRSAYRNEADFHIEQLQASRPRDSGPHLARIIDPDASVSKNYERMAWKRMYDLDRAAPGNLTFGQYRKESLGDLQAVMQDLFSDPTLSLQDFGGIQAGSFRFAKGNVEDFHYKNLSGGEKAAFDILLDVFLKRDETKDAVFCIDEPELHVATNLQGSLITSVLKLLPDASQLWIATHSIGVVREAYRMHQEQPGKVAFLDFSDRNLDTPVTIKPSKPNRAFWNNIYKVALDDLSSLVAPECVVICEGSKDKSVRAFDAKCYNQLFASSSPETLFISQGGSSEVIRSEHLAAILQSIAHGMRVWKLIDRDNMTDGEREKKIAQGLRVLHRREIEEYLYDPDVIRTFLQTESCDETTIESVLNEREDLLNKQVGPKAIKDVSRDFFEAIRSITSLPNLGNNRDEFALQFLVPALCRTPCVYDELREDVFGSD